jgi:uncharacterized membrane protein (UPF0127 family)
MKKITPRLLAFALISCASSNFLSNAAIAQSMQNRLPVAELRAGMYVIKAEVAATEASRKIGMMMRTQMGANEGMVFDFQESQQYCMWMKNTLIPLSVAFIDEHGVIVNIEEMQAEKLDSHCAKKPVRYALEMNKEWFKQKNIKAGTKIVGLPLQAN